MKFLRGTFLDVFGYSEERKMERQLIKDYEADLKDLQLASNLQAAIELARSPLEIRGFGPVKHSNYLRVEERRTILRKSLNSKETVSIAAE